MRFIRQKAHCYLHRISLSDADMKQSSETCASRLSRLLSVCPKKGFCFIFQSHSCIYNHPTGIQKNADSLSSC